MRFDVVEGSAGLVRLTNDARDTRVVPRDVAIRLYLQHHRPARKPTTEGHVLVLSFAVPEEVAHHAVQFVCVSDVIEEGDEGGEGGGPSPPPPPPADWPRWAGDPPPWRTVTGGVWTALDDGGEPGILLRACERERAQRESRVSQGLEERCRRIAEHGDQADFTGSLDYYTTLRVRCAFLRWNAHGLQERMRAVRARIDAHLRCLRAASGDLSGTFTPPSAAAAVAEGMGDPVSEDPNALCVPQAHDYDLD